MHFHQQLIDTCGSYNIQEDQNWSKTIAADLGFIRDVGGQKIRDRKDFFAHNKLAKLGGCNRRVNIGAKIQNKDLVGKNTKQKISHFLWSTQSNQMALLVLRRRQL